MIDLDRKKQLIEELLSHLDRSQGGDLQKMVEASKAPKDMALGGDPKGVSIEKIDVMKPKSVDDKVNEAIAAHGEKPGDAMSDIEPDSDADDSDDSDDKGDDEKLSDEELAEMLKKYLV